MKVVVLKGGRSSEHDVSLASAEGVAAGLREAGHDILEILIDREGNWHHDGKPLAITPGAGLLDARVAFPVLHGPYGEDGTVQGLLEHIGVAYVGSGVLSSAVGMNKKVFKELMAHERLPQVQYRALRADAWSRDPQSITGRCAELGWPLFVKPARLGSSIGISKVHEESELGPALDAAFAHDSIVLAEQMATGKEIECAVIGIDDPQASVPGEVIPQAEWYDYEAKYRPGGMELKVPAQISEAAAKRVQELAVAVYAKVGAAGMARVDFFVDGDKVLISEINTIPGFTPTSVFPKLWEASGLAYPKLLDRLLEEAVASYEHYQHYRH